MTVTLVSLLVTGVTVATILQAQMTRQRRLTLGQEAAVAAALYSNLTSGTVSQSATEKEYALIARHYGAMIEIVPMEGERTCYYETGKWDPIAQIRYSDADLTMLFLTLSETGDPSIHNYRDYVDFPVMTVSTVTTPANGIPTAVLFHSDITDLKTEIHTVYLEVLLVALVTALVAIIAVYSTTTQLTRPFMEVNEIVQRYSKGDYNARIPISNTEEATQLAVSFNAMANQLKDLEATRQSFVANISHELRSPLTSMKGFLEAMQDGTIGPEEHEKYIDIVLSETKRMVSMVNDLLDLARIESGKTAIKPEVFDINELIRRTLLTFEARFYEKRMEVEVKFAQDLYYVEADNAQISQVLRNLIDNAIKYSPEDRKLRIATYAMRRDVYVSIQDFGQGIPEEDVPHVFDRFYKVEKAHTRTTQSGTGLGLSIVKRIIDQHGQTITLKSAKGRGSTFTFTLKRAPSPKRQDGGRKA